MASAHLRECIARRRSPTGLSLIYNLRGLRRCRLPKREKSRLNSMHRQLRAPRAHLPTLAVSNPNLARIHFTCTIQQFATVGQVSCCTLRSRGRLPCDSDDGVDPVITHAHPTGENSRTNEPLLLAPTQLPQGALCSEI